MNFLKNPKKTAALILAMKKPSGEEGYDEQPAAFADGANQDYELGLKAAAKDLIDAVKAEDESGVMGALKDFVSMCMDEEENSSEGSLPE